MEETKATEIAYKNGYKKGVEDTERKIYNFAKDFFEWDEEGFVRELAEYLEIKE